LHCKTLTFRPLVEAHLSGSRKLMTSPRWSQQSELDRYGARRDEMPHIFEIEGNWGRLLQMFVARAAAV